MTTSQMINEMIRISEASKFLSKEALLRTQRIDEKIRIGERRRKRGKRS